MVRKVFYVLVIVIVLCFSWLGLAIITNQKTVVKSEIDRTNIKENRIEYNEEKFDENQIKDSYDGFSIIPSSVKYDLINRFYTASNSYLIASYNVNNKQIELELTFKADGTFFLYHGLDEAIAYEGEYKLIDKKIFAKVNKVYKDNVCFDNTTLITEFDILEKNGRKVIDLMIGDIEFIEIHKKNLRQTNNKFNNRKEIISC